MSPSRPSPSASSSPVQALAIEARAFVVAGHDDAARAAYDELVVLLQRRACRLAFYYLRDAGDADEATQDAFVKAYMHLRSYRDSTPFEAWFTRILVNGCLDRLKARRRRWQWLSPLEVGARDEGRVEPSTPESTPEDALMQRELQQTLGAAIDRLPERQRTVVLLTHLDGRTPREISQITGMNENTVRVHLFRAVRRLRTWLTPTVGAAATGIAKG